MARGVPRNFDAAAFKAARARKNWTVSELARRSKVGRSTIHAWESETANPQIDFLRKTLEALEVASSEVILVPEDERTLADWRGLRLLLQPELAARMRSHPPVSISHISQLETGTSELTETMAAKLATALDLDVTKVRAAWVRSREREVN